MNKLKTETLIIGAGPAGLACAHEMAKAGKDFIVVERDSCVGGLAKTYTFEEDGLIFRTDNGPHRFFSKNKYLYDMIEGLIDERWIQVKRQTRQHIDGKFYDYPVNTLQALKNVGFLRAMRMGFDYIIGRLRYGLFKKPIRSFEDYVVANFGRSLGELNMINYTEKIWGIPASTIHPDWAGQRIKGLSISSLLMDSLRRILNVTSSNKPKTLVDAFYYPQFGTGLIYDTIAQQLTDKGYTIILDTEPTTLSHNGTQFRTATLKNKKTGEQTEIEFTNLVESIPLPSFIKLLDPQIPEQIAAAGSKLAHRSQVYLFITLDKESVTADQWIYFPSKNIPIGRMSEMRNFSPDMSPAGKTSLFLEYFCFEGDELWNMTDAELFELSMRHFDEIGFFARDEVRKYYVIKQKDVYPIYDLDYQERLRPIKAYLDSFENLYYIGRPGRFKYNNQDHSLEMGILAGRSIIEGDRYDIESVGEEKEYFEKATLPSEQKAS